MTNAHRKDEATSGYALGYTDSEHDRLIRQAKRLRSCTEALFRDAGVCEGLRVLDIGSGIGDVSMLAAQLVGPSGHVVGVERDPRSVARAQERATEAGLRNVDFLASDVAEIGPLEPFDAVVGRFILQFIPDPVAALKNVAQLLRPKGIIALQEVSWAPSLAANARLPLWTACAAIVHEAVGRAGADTNVGVSLFRYFHEAGFGEPQIRLEMQLGTSPELVLWTYYLLQSVRHGMPTDLTLEALGDLDTLPERLQSEVQSARFAVASVGVVSAYSRLL